MVEPSSAALSLFQPLIGPISEQVEFWKDYKGRRIRIRRHEVTRSMDDNIKQTSYIIEGEILEVMSFPPGFRLGDVSERIGTSDFAVSEFATGIEATPIREHEEETRTVDEKFVSFTAIEELEMWKKPTSRRIHDCQRHRCRGRENREAATSSVTLSLL